MNRSADLDIRIRMGAALLAIVLVAAVASLLRIDRDLTRASRNRLEAQLSTDAARVAGEARAEWAELGRRFRQAVEMERAPSVILDVLSRGGRLESARLYRIDDAGGMWTDTGWSEPDETGAQVIEAFRAGREAVAFGSADGGDDGNHLLIGRVDYLPDGLLMTSLRATSGPIWIGTLSLADFAVAILPGALASAGIGGPGLTDREPAAEAGNGTSVELPPRRVRVTSRGSEIWATSPSAGPGEGRSASTADRVRAENTVVNLDIPPPDNLLFLGPTDTGLELEVEVAPAAGSIDGVVARERRTRLVAGLLMVLLAGAAGTTLLLAARRSLLLAERQRAFVSLVGHEIRTPLAALRGAVENLRDGVVTDPGRYSVLIETQLRRIEDLAEDALEAARTGAPVPVEDRSLIDLPRVVSSVASENEAEVEVAWAGTAPSDPAGRDNLVRASERELRRALQNLVRNATVHGRPPVRIVIERGPDHWTLKVSDQGDGFDADELSRLRRPFERGEQAVRLQRPGSGLGLAVANDVIEALGGSMVLANGETGALVTITLPAHHD